GTAAGGMEATGVRSGRSQTRGDDERDRSVGGDGSRSAHRRRRDPRSNRGQNRVETVNAWASGAPGGNVNHTAPTGDSRVRRSVYRNAQPAPDRRLRPWGRPELF